MISFLETLGELVAGLLLCLGVVLFIKASILKQQKKAAKFQGKGDPWAL